MHTKTQTGALPRVTYSNTDEDFSTLHSLLDEALVQFQGALDKHRPNWIGRDDDEGSVYRAVSPVDKDVVLGEFVAATPAAVARAVRVAHAAFPGWSKLGWAQRVAILRRVADEVEKRKYELAAATLIEVGKSRIEAIGEAEEVIDLIHYYCSEMEQSNGYDRQLARARANETTRSVQRAHGVFGVIAPFNFPLALPTGMLTAALLTGNTTIFKPSPMAGLTASLLLECFRSGGVPAEVVSMVCGGDETGSAIVTANGVDGIAFTGSHKVGMTIFRQFNSDGFARPVLAEMGGKNPSYVTKNADLKAAASGIIRSAFGLQGQKCASNSVTYVQRDVVDMFVSELLAQAAALKLGDPRQTNVFMGPVINSASVERWKKAVEAARHEGKILHGGNLPKGGIFDRGPYVEPTVVADLPAYHWLHKEEIFAPFLAISSFDTLEDAIERGNAVRYGLTAGIYTREEKELAFFLEHAQAGVLYANRPTGATTGAWPGTQTFCGWKGSGITGKGGLGPWYLPQFMREQSHTVLG